MADRRLCVGRHRIAAVPMDKILLAVAIAGLASAGTAAVTYDVVTTTATSRGSERAVGQIWFDGDAYRAEIERGGKRTVVISRDADRSAVILDDRARTWSYRSRVDGDVRSSALFRWPVAGAHTVGKPRIRYSRIDGIVIAGQKSVRHTIDATFEVEGASDGIVVRGSFHVTATAWTTTELPELPIQRPLRTGYPAVDSELAKAQQSIHGMVLQHHLEVSRELQGGPVVTEKTTTVIEHLRQTDIEPSIFEVPSAYAYIGPVAPH
jgi:hypothetical protein